MVPVTRRHINVVARRNKRKITAGFGDIWVTIDDNPFSTASQESIDILDRDLYSELYDLKGNNTKRTHPTSVRRDEKLIFLDLMSNIYKQITTWALQIAPMYSGLKTTHSSQKRLTRMMIR